MRLTTARYFTPSGRSIQAEGIEPDILIEQAKIEKVADASAKGPARTEASLRGHLENPNGKKEDEKKAGDKKAAPKAEEDEGEAPADILPLNDKDKAKDAKSSTEIAEDDYQLAYALDLIKGLALTQKRAPAAAGQ
jgi:carboxyl-terminal processing protease